MSSGKHASDEGFELGNIPWKTIGIIIIVIVVIIGVFFGGKTAYSALISNENFFNKKKPEENVIVIEEEKMPTQISGYKVLGELKIDNRNFSQYILEVDNTKEIDKESTGNIINNSSENINSDNTTINTENTDTIKNNSIEISNALDKGLVKLYGDKINQKGNFSIIGHNEEAYFSILNELTVNDKFSIKDSSNIEKQYIITEIFTVEPTDLKCLMPNKNYTEVTLITCTSGSNQRLVVKGIEEIDYKKFTDEKLNSSVNEQKTETDTAQ